MKKFIAIILVLASIIAVIVVGLSDKKSNSDYLRIHIKANSNSEVDRDIKYLVKDRVVSFLTPFISNCKTKSEFEDVLSKNIENIVGITNELLAQNNFDYKSKVKINSEYFPLRDYSGLTLKSGYYDALSITLGEGEGDNWWCVVYPPLCFTEGVDTIYRSRLLDVIKNFLRGKN